jgi:hypothetical protein
MDQEEISRIIARSRQLVEEYEATASLSKCTLQDSRKLLEESRAILEKITELFKTIKPVVLLVLFFS